MRIGLALVLALWSTSAAARVDLASANGTVFGVEDTQGGQLSAPEAFVGWPKLCVRTCGDACADACAPADIYDAQGVAAQVEQGGRQLTLAARQIAGLEVRRRIFVAGAGADLANGFVRYLDSLTNNTGAPIEVAVRVGSVTANERLREGTAQIWRTSSDDAVLEPFDRWVVTDDGDAFGGTPAVASLAHGSGARERPAVFSVGYPAANEPETLAWQFETVTVAPGATVSFLSFIVHESLRLNAIDEVDHLLGMRPQDALFGLTDAERLTVLNFDVEAGNGAPVANVGGPYSVDEGSPIEFNAGASLDPDGGELTYAWDLDGDGDFDDHGNFSNASLTYPDNGVFTISVRVTDQSGKTDEDTARVVVRNVAPRIDSVNNSDSPLDEGGVFRVGVTVVDPGADVLTYSFDWDGNGSYDDDYTAATIAQASHQYIQDGTYTARLRVTDDDAGTTFQDFEVVVNNVAPSILQVIANTPIREGSDLTISVVAVDPGQDSFSYEYDLDGDGDFTFDEGSQDQRGADLDQVTTRYADDGLVTAQVRLTDAQGAQSVTEVLVSVTNANPIIDGIRVSHSGPVAEGTPFYEGQPLIIDIDARDPGVNDELRFYFDLDNDGDFQDDVENSPDPFTEHAFPDDGRFVIGAQVRDDDQGFGVASVEVEIENLPPEGVLSGPAFANEGEPVELVLEASDPGNDTLSYDWDLDANGVFEIIASPVTRQTISFEDQGDYVVQVRINDGDGGQTVVTHDLRVRNVIPTLMVVAPETANEGAEIVVRADANDPGNDALTYAYDFDNDGDFEIEETDEDFIRWTYPDDGIYTVRVIVDDGANLIDGTAVVRVENVDPTVVLTSNSPVDEGSEMRIEAEVTDPGTDEITLSWDLDGDGEFEIEAPYLVAEDLVQTAVTRDDGRIEVTVRATDDDDGVGEALHTVTVVNLPPTFGVIGNLREAEEGLRYTQALPAMDPGVDDRLSCALVNPPAGMDIVAEACLIDWVPTFDQALASPIQATVRATDGDGGAAEIVIEITVRVQDLDEDGLPDTYERSVGLDPENPDDATEDTDGDGRDNLAEWRDETDPFVFEGPQAPILEAPDNGTRILSSTPTLETQYVVSSLGDTVRIAFEIYADAEHERLIIDSELVDQVEDEGASWTVPAAILLEDQAYFWRAKGVTANAETEWSETWSFRINADNRAPATPELRAPADGASLAEETVQLETLFSDDPDGDPVRYIFQLYRRPVGGAADGSDDMVSESGTGEIRAEFVSASFGSLIENQIYAWDVVAVDELGAQSERSERRTFTLNTSNDAPSVPTIISPEDGAALEEGMPTFVAGGSRDDDSLETFYHFRVRPQGGDAYVAESEPVLGVDGEASWQPSERLEENAWFTVDVHASDGEAESGIVSASFFVSTVDDPPAVPEPQFPANGATVSLESASMSWSSVEDPEGTEVRYLVTICDSSDVCQTSLPLRSTAWAAEAYGAEAGKTYRWYVEAYDTYSSGAGTPELITGSGESETFTFTVEGGGDGGGGGGGCSVSSGSGDAPWPLALGLLLGFVGLRRTRD